MIACTNEYEALTDEAYDVMHYFGEVFKMFVTLHPEFAVRELEYLAEHAITQTAAEIILKSAVKKRKERLKSK